ncbi:hypothetical protein ACSVDA_13830 [Cytobacillus sp. Hm23]
MINKLGVKAMLTIMLVFIPLINVVADLLITAKGTKQASVKIDYIYSRYILSCVIDI